MSQLIYEGKIFKTNNYGSLVVTKYVNASLVYVKFIETGYETVAEMNQIKKGNVKDRLVATVWGVGILGDEPACVHGKHLKEYMLWGSMLKRCYDDKYHSKHPTYKDCYVSEKFKYYPYFKNWCSRQVGFNQAGWELDKDILLKGNKFYSEDTCVFIPQEINKLLSKQNNNQDKYPVGIYYDSREKNFQSKINNGEKQVRIGRFCTLEEAFQAYKQAKEAQIKTIANKWKDQIDIRAYKALMVYQVESQIDLRSISPSTIVKDLEAERHG
ncbi:hypothetical protein [Acinetobacter bereziniae]|uniref:hypothetical protein n=1 Tax=Acinetobacter bereziniae TaxID=106648 RepID=UPI0018FFFD84|nr:hypothetical protein [Acinetobacter bereziniae]MBJ9902053.1 hypothetical protein [Acinetobacter bereziniae]MCU4317924.1 hypothetical protein [Acinetobacter bereziniae]MCU4597738.1 hypothetical protein [Acinetobacter bereziniae]